MKSKPIPIRFPEDVHQKLSDAASAAGTTFADFVRQAAEKAAETACKRCKGSGVDPLR